MREKSTTEQTSDRAKRNADDDASTGTNEAPRDTVHANVDPAQAVMESNPNPSPPIHPNP